LLDKKVEHFSRSALFLPLAKMIIASSIMGVTLYVPLKLLDQLVFDTTRTFGLILLTGTTSFIGLCTYFFLSWVLGVGEVQSVFALLRKVRNPRELLFEPAREVVNGGMQDKIS
ncbi:MAG: hypothetical protein Q7S76_02655, partial [bacterium]|nr:hypothetical protein [bacterium]